MAEANFNLVLDAEARFAAADMQKRLGIPYIELTRLYQLDKIKNQYTLFAAALGSKFDDDDYFDPVIFFLKKNILFFLLLFIHHKPGCNIDICRNKFFPQRIRQHLLMNN